MTTYAMFAGFALILFVIMWYPGFMLARNMVKAVSNRNPTAGENVLACLPGINTGVARTALYGSAKLVYIPFALAIIMTVVRYIMYYLFPEAVFAGFCTLIVTWVVYVITWLLNGYVLWDMGTCIQAGFVTKILGFICPPLAQWAIGRNCIPLMAAVLAELETERQREDYVGDSN